MHAFEWALIHTKCNTITDQRMEAMCPAKNIIILKMTLITHFALNDWRAMKDISDSALADSEVNTGVHTSINTYNLRCKRMDLTGVRSSSTCMCAHVCRSMRTMSDCRALRTWKVGTPIVPRRGLRSVFP